jgi:hypothetical protein
MHNNIEARLALVRQLVHVPCVQVLADPQHGPRVEAGHVVQSLELVAGKYLTEKQAQRGKHKIATNVRLESILD